MSEKATTRYETENLHVASAMDSDDGTFVGYTEEELRQAEQNPRTAITRHPPSLGYVSIGLIITNRMIGKIVCHELWSPADLTPGTGIFKTPSTLAHGTRSVGYAMIFWAIGAVVAMAGILTFVDLGLAMPKLHVSGRDNEDKGEHSVPKNGGEKNYVHLPMHSTPPIC